MTDFPVPLSDLVDYGDLGRVLREARKARGYTLRQVAAHLKVSEGFVSHVEGGKKRPGQDTTIAWAQYLGLPPERMLNLAGHLTVRGVGEAAREVPFDDFIRGRKDLTSDQKNALLTMYLSYVSPKSSRSRRR